MNMSERAQIHLRCCKFTGRQFLEDEKVPDSFKVRKPRVEMVAKSSDRVLSKYKEQCWVQFHHQVSSESSMYVGVESSEPALGPI
jgi:hypothetical protein